MAAGLASRGRENRGVFDRFRGRIMFPLCDERGRVLGFGARALREDQRPKYLNTSDGEVFHKGRMVYGADLARADAARAGRVVLVEGYTDVIALRQAGRAGGGRLDGHGADRLAGRRAAPAGADRAVLPGPGRRGPERGGQERRGAAGPQREVRHPRVRLPGRARCPPGKDPADVAVRGRRWRCGSCWSGPSRSRASRSSGRSSAATSRTSGRDRVLDEVVPIDRPAAASVLREELVQLVAGRLSVTATSSPRRSPTRRAGRARGGGPREAGRPPTARRSAARGSGEPPPPPARGGIRRATPAGGETAPATRAPTVVRGPIEFDDPGPGRPTARRVANGAHRVLDRREQTERAFLAYCLALPDEGEAGWRTPTSTSSSPRPRPAAPPSTSAAASAPRPPTSRAATSPRPPRRRARHPRRRARGHTGQARARGPPARPLPPGPPDRRRPRLRGRGDASPRRRAPAGPRRDPPSPDVTCASPRHTISVRHTN